MTLDPRNQSPFNALPPVVVGLSLLLVAPELLFQAGAAGLVGGREAVGWRLDAIRDWAVATPVWDWMLANRQAPPEFLARFVTYPFLHAGLGHALFAAVFVLAFGNVTHPWLPGWRQLAIFFGAALAGALAYVLVHDGSAPLFGGYPGAYGLIGAFTLLARRGTMPIPPERAFLLLGFLLAIQPIFGLVGGAGLSWIPDWTAEIAGAATGYGLAALLGPGGTARLLDRLRQR